MSAEIINRGRGPEIAGTRLTIYDMMDYLLMGWDCNRIAEWFKRSPEEIQAAIDYIDEHYLESVTEYQRILARNEAAKNPPWVEQKLKESHAKLEAKMKEIQNRKRSEANDNGNSGGR